MYTTTIHNTALHNSLDIFILQALAYANHYRQVAYYTSNQIPYPHNGFETIIAFSNNTPALLDETNAFDSLRKLTAKNNSLLCGYLSYDLKNRIEKLVSEHPDHVSFPLIFFFVPEVYLHFTNNTVTVSSTVDNISQLLQEITATPIPQAAPLQGIKIKQRVSKEEYTQQVERIRQHIIEGNVYELNYCMEFYAEQLSLEPLPLFLALKDASPTPFAGYLKANDKYLLCASPERFLKKEGKKLISQPIKGTIRRGTTPEEDLRLQAQLRNDEKELAENMMIVDLVRNDLRRSCATGTVQVEEMFGIYGFRQVSQMISTITGELQPDKDLVDALQGAFPMGSMTGAPKIRAMQIIEELEVTRRGLYSGAFGYITPEQDCDFNVVIRSMQYNASSGYLSFMVGSAITYDSDPAAEYQECLLKAKAIMNVLGTYPN